MSKSKTSSKGRLIVVSAPSGSGKNTVFEAALKEDTRLIKSVSHTTRPARAGEKHGKDYYFVSRDEFHRMIRRKKFVEWVHMFGNLYGTSFDTIQKQLSTGKDVVLIIEGRGGKAIRRLYKDAVFIRIVPPSLKALKERIEQRSGESPFELKKRLRSAAREMKALKWYTYTVINDRLPVAVKNFHSIIRAERLKTASLDNTSG